MVDGDSQRASRLPRLLERVELIAHVVERGLEQLSDRRYWPCRHVWGLESDYQPVDHELAIGIWNPNIPGPKSRWSGADFGPKPLKRPGPGNPGPGIGGMLSCVTRITCIGADE